MTKIVSTPAFPDSVLVHTRVHGVPLEIRIPRQALAEALCAETSFPGLVHAVTGHLKLIQEAAFAKYSMTREAQVVLAQADLAQSMLFTEPPPTQTLYSHAGAMKRSFQPVGNRRRPLH